MPRLKAATHSIDIDRATLFELGRPSKVRRYARQLLPPNMIAVERGRIVFRDHGSAQIAFRVAVYESHWIEWETTYDAPTPEVIRAAQKSADQWIEGQS